MLLKIGTRTKQQVQSHAQKYQKHIEDEVSLYWCCYEVECEISVDELLGRCVFIFECTDCVVLKTGPIASGERDFPSITDH